MRQLEVAQGTRVPVIEGFDAAGNEIRIDPAKPNTKTLVLVFSTTCKYSEDNFPNWKRLLAENQSRLRNRSLQVVLIDIASRETATYVVSHRLAGMTVIARAGLQTMKAYNLSMSPQTMLLVDGRVLKVWSGVLGSQQMRSIEDTLATH